VPALTSLSSVVEADRSCSRNLLYALNFRESRPRTSVNKARAVIKLSTRGPISGSLHRFLEPLGPLWYVVWQLHRVARILLLTDLRGGLCNAVWGAQKRLPMLRLVAFGTGVTATALSSPTQKEVRKERVKVPLSICLLYKLLRSARLCDRSWSAKAMNVRVAHLRDLEDIYDAENRGGWIATPALLLCLGLPRHTRRGGESPTCQRGWPGARALCARSRGDDLPPASVVARR
jgi:hypothetical protein